MSLLGHFRRINHSNRIKQRRFQEIIDSVKLMASNVDSIVEKSAIYDFVIWALGRQLVADSYVSFITNRDVTKSHWFDIRSFFSVPRKDTVRVDMDIAKCVTYTGPWNANRFPSCFLSVAAHGFLDSENNAKGIYYPELHFAVMASGKHHTSWAVFMGECKTTMEIVSLKDYFPIVSTDGAIFSYCQKDITVTEKAVDCRFAAMYRLAQIKWEKGYPDTMMRDVNEHPASLANLLNDHLKQADCKSLEEAWQTMFKSTEEYRTKFYIQEQEAMYWKQQCSLKDQRIQGLEQQLLSSK